MGNDRNGKAPPCFSHASPMLLFFIKFIAHPGAKETFMGVHNNKTVQAAKKITNHKLQKLLNNATTLHILYKQRGILRFKNNY